MHVKDVVVEMDPFLYYVQYCTEWNLAKLKLTTDDVRLAFPAKKRRRPDSIIDLRFSYDRKELPYEYTVPTVLCSIHFVLVYGSTEPLHYEHLSILIDLVHAQSSLLAFHPFTHHISWR